MLLSGPSQKSGAGYLVVGSIVCFHSPTAQRDGLRLPAFIFIHWKLHKKIIFCSREQKNCAASSSCQKKKAKSDVPLSAELMLNDMTTGLDPSTPPPSLAMGTTGTNTYAKKKKKGQEPGRKFPLLSSQNRSPGLVSPQREPLELCLVLTIHSVTRHMLHGLGAHK